MKKRRLACLSICSDADMQAGTRPLSAAHRLLSRAVGWVLDGLGASRRAQNPSVRSRTKLPSLAFRRRAQKLSPTRPGRLGLLSQSARESNNAVFTGSTPLKTPIVYMVCVLYAQHPLSCPDLAWFAIIKSRPPRAPRSSVFPLFLHTNITRLQL